MDFTWIVPERLAVGSADFTAQFVADNGFDVVICVAPREEVPSAPHPDLLFPVSLSQPDRTSAENMLAAAEACLGCIAARKAVYLHCIMGFNRSAAVAVMTVERLFGVSRREAGEYVAARRHVDPAKHLALFDKGAGKWIRHASFGI